MKPVFGRSKPRLKFIKFGHRWCKSLIFQLLFDLADFIVSNIKGQGQGCKNIGIKNLMLHWEEEGGGGSGEGGG